MSHNIPVYQPIPDELRTTFRSSLYNIEAPPQVSKHKNDIYIWIAYWPWSMLWTLLSDPITRLLRHTYNAISSILERMSAHAFKGTEADLDKHGHSR